MATALTAQQQDVIGEYDEAIAHYTAARAFFQKIRNYGAATECTKHLVMLRKERQTALEQFMEQQAASD